MRLSPRYRTLLAADLAGGLTSLVMVLPFVHFAYQSTALHATIETMAGMIAMLAAFLMLGRFRRTFRSEDLVIATALGFVACANFIFSAMPWALLSEDSMRFSAWTSLVGTTVGAAILAVGGFLPSRRLKRPKQAAGTVLGVSLAGYLCAGVLIGVFAKRLPLGFDPTTAEPTNHLQVVGSHSLVSMQLAAAAFFMIAAIGFTRRGERTGDDLMTWLAASAALASFARLNYALFPSLYTSWVYVGDALRLGSNLLLLAGAAREIVHYQRRLADAAAMEERRRIARELHDGLAQELAFVAAQGRSLSRNPDAIEIKYLAAAAERALDESRRAIVLLTNPPDEPLDRALVQTVEELVNRMGGRAAFDVEEGVDVPPKTREALLRIVREAVTNAGRHGRANLITVGLENGDGVRLRIVDDGVGFDPTAVALDESSGFGLTTMRKRTEAIGGRLTISRVAEGGTEVEVVIP
ncbi:MAG TPA: sensor histidine kinase [Gaiellaceae bacterium]|nr:sensor histidine kinase [Gaiellaceae bacterium]